MDDENESDSSEQKKGGAKVPGNIGYMAANALDAGSAIAGTGQKALNYGAKKLGKNSAKTASSVAKKLGSVSAKLSKGAAVAAKIGAIISSVAFGFLIFIIVVGLIVFLVTGMGFIMTGLKQISAAFFELQNGKVKNINDEQIINLADRIEKMGYDLYGYGFSLRNNIFTYNKNEGKNVLTYSNYENGTSDIAFRNLVAYLMSDNYANVPKNDNTNLSSLSAFFEGEGLIGVYEEKDPIFSSPIFGSKGKKYDGNVTIDRESRKLVIEQKQSVLEKLINIIHATNIAQFTYNLDGWTGRYSMPLEFLLSTHIATGSPDLTYALATKFKTNVDIIMHDANVYKQDIRISLPDGQTIEYKDVDKLSGGPNDYILNNTFEVLKSMDDGAYKCTGPSYELIYPNSIDQGASFTSTDGNEWYMPEGFNYDGKTEKTDEFLKENGGVLASEFGESYTSFMNSNPNIKEDTFTVNGEEYFISSEDATRVYSASLKSESSLDCKCFSSDNYEAYYNYSNADKNKGEAYYNGSPAVCSGCAQLFNDVKKSLEALDSALKDVKYYVPYINKVDNHWFRNVYFTKNAIGSDNIIETDNEYEKQTGERWTLYETYSGDEGEVSSDDYKLYVINPENANEIKDDDTNILCKKLSEEEKKGLSSGTWYKLDDDGITYVKTTDANEAEYKLVYNKDDYPEYNGSFEKIRVEKKAITKTVADDWMAYKHGIEYDTGWQSVDESDDSNIKNLLSNNAKIEYKMEMNDYVTQVEDGVRGETNPTIKKLFLDDYFLYDGSPKRAAVIEIARAMGAKTPDGNTGDGGLEAYIKYWGTEYEQCVPVFVTPNGDYIIAFSKYVEDSNNGKDKQDQISTNSSQFAWSLPIPTGAGECDALFNTSGDKLVGVKDNEGTQNVYLFDKDEEKFSIEGKEPIEVKIEYVPLSEISGSISLNKSSLTAFSVLKNMHTLDAEYIYHDFKELVTELNYFDKEDLVERDNDVMMFPISGMSAEGWPISRYDKNSEFYGTLIHSAKDMQALEAQTNKELSELMDIALEPESDSEAEPGEPEDAIILESGEIQYDNIFLQAAEDIHKYMEKNNYTYCALNLTRNNGNKGCQSHFDKGEGCKLNDTFEESINDAHHACCATFVMWCLKAIGIDNINTHATITFMEQADNAKDVFEVIDTGRGAQIESLLQPGDIVWYRKQDGSGGHVQIYVGKDKNGNTLWYTVNNDKSFTDGSPTTDSNYTRFTKIIRIKDLSKYSYKGIKGTSSSSAIYSGYEGGTPVIAPVTGEIIKYGVVERTNIEKNNINKENEDSNIETKEKVGFIKIRVLGSNERKYGKPASNSIFPTERNTTGYGYNDFWEEYADAGINDNVVYIEGFDVSQILENQTEYNEDDAKGENIKKLYNYIIANGSEYNNYSTTYTVPNLLNDEKEKELKEQEERKKEAAYAINYQTRYYIKEGAVIGFTYPDTDETHTTEKKVDDTSYKVGNYLRIIFRDTQDEVIENVEDYIQVDHNAVYNPSKYDISENNYEQIANLLSNITYGKLKEVAENQGIENEQLDMIIGTTWGEAYFTEPYLLYGWACAMINHKYKYDDIKGWGAYYSKENVNQHFNECKNDLSNKKNSVYKAVYLALTRRNTDIDQCWGPTIKPQDNKIIYASNLKVHNKTIYITIF